MLGNAKCPKPAKPSFLSENRLYRLDNARPFQDGMFLPLRLRHELQSIARKSGIYRTTLFHGRTGRSHRVRTSSREDERSKTERREPRRHKGPDTNQEIPPPCMKTGKAAPKNVHGESWIPKTVFILNKKRRWTRVVPDNLRTRPDLLRACTFTALAPPPAARPPDTSSTLNHCHYILSRLLICFCGTLDLPRCESASCPSVLSGFVSCETQPDN